MIIGIDIRCLVEGRRTGVEEYTLNLLDNLFTMDKKNKYVLFLNAFKEPKFDARQFSKFKNVSIKRFKFPNKLLNFLFWYLSWPKIDKLIGGADILFLPNIIFGSVSKNTKLILTIHDLSFERYPDTYSLKRRLWHIFINPKKLCQRADKIIAVSDSTKNDIVNLYKIAPDKIEVINSSVPDSYAVVDRNDQRLLGVKEKYKLPYKFILYLGTIEPRKNILGLIRAYNLLRKEKHSELDKYKLVIAGAPGWKQKKIFDEISRSQYRNDIIFVGFVENEDKPLMLNLATLFVYPSFFEGFGFPPLEAMKCGIPVIVSNSSSFAEIIGEAGLMIDPDKPDEIYKAMKELILNKELWQKIREKGLLQAQKFDWKKTAKDFLKIIQKFNK
jgi:glycosyltransferase involved in cell wall biosynthesis